jgi:hypothetical protein
MTLSIKTPWIESHYAECRYAECCDLFIVMLNVVLLSALMLNFVAPRGPRGPREQCGPRVIGGKDRNANKRPNAIERF